MSALFTTPALVCLGIYTLAVAFLLWANHRLHRKPKPQPEVVNWLPFLPPVSPTQAEIEAMWLAPWPTNLTDQQVDRLFDDIVAIEGLDR